MLRIGASVTMAADRPPPWAGGGRQGGAGGRWAGDPQHGDRRRQPFRPDALWRFRRGAAGARRDRSQIGTGEDLGSQDSCACARGSTALSLRVSFAFRRPRHSASSRVSRVKPKGVSVLTIAAVIDGDGRARSRAAPHRARLHGRPSDPRQGGRRSAGRRALTEEGVAPAVAAVAEGVESDHRCDGQRLVPRRGPAGAFPPAAAEPRRHRTQPSPPGRKDGEEGSGPVDAQRRGEGRVRRERRDAAQGAARQARRHVAQGRLPPGHLRRLLGAWSTANCSCPA